MNINIKYEYLVLILILILMLVLTLILIFFGGWGLLLRFGFESAWGNLLLGAGTKIKIPINILIFFRGLGAAPKNWFRECLGESYSYEQGPQL